MSVLLRAACWRSRPPSSDVAATAAVDQIKKKSAAARPLARLGFAARAAFARAGKWQRAGRRA